MRLLYTHPDFIVIDKPANLSFHGQDTRDDYQLGVVDLAAQAFGYERLWPVHRLDTMTSGLLILATHAQAAAAFGELFAQRQLDKYYLALSNHKPKKKQGWVKGDMAPARRGAYKLMTSQNNPAITQFISASVRPSLRLFLLKPHTGKTHQLRVMMKSLSSAIIGDRRYQNSTEAEQFDRGYLHAYALRFVWKNETIHLTNPPTEGAYFLLPETQAILKQWQAPWTLL